MTPDKEITEILKGLRRREGFADVNYDKLAGLFSSGLRMPSFESSIELARIKQKIRNDGARGYTPRAWFLNLRVMVPAAASLVLIAALAIFIGIKNNPAEAVSVCGLSSGDVRLVRNDLSHALEAGMKVKNGDTVVTGRSSGMDLVYGEDVIVRLKENTSLLVESLESKNDNLLFKVEVARGTALFEFRKLSAGDSALIRTPLSVAVVKGTAFGVQVGDDRNVRYEVLEGKIRVKKRVLLDDAVYSGPSGGETARVVEEFIDNNAVVVEKGQVCSVSSADQKRLSDAVRKAVVVPVHKDGEARMRSRLETTASAEARPSVLPSAVMRPLMLDDLSRLTGEQRAAMDAKEVKFTVRAIPLDAVIFIDGVEKGRAPLTLSAAPGRYMVEAKSPGFESGKIQVEVSDESKEFDIVLGKGRDIPLDFSVWKERARSRFILSDPRLPFMVYINDKGRVDAVSDNRLKWTLSLGVEINSYPVWDAENIYCTTADERVVAVSLADGRPVWNRKLDGVLYASRLVFAGNTLIAATSKGWLYRIDKNGNVSWMMELPGGIFSAPAVRNNLVFVPVQDGILYVIDLNMRLVVLKIQTGKMVGSSPIVSDGKVYCANLNGDLICYDLEKEEVAWKSSVGGRVVTAPILDGGHLYVATSYGYVLKYTLAGSPVWRVYVGGVIDTAPVLNETALYVLARDIFCVIDKERGSVRWSYVVPSTAVSNIAFSGNTLYFGTSKKGIVSFNKL